MQAKRASILCSQYREQGIQGSVLHVPEVTSLASSPWPWRERQLCLFIHEYGGSEKAGKMARLIQAGGCMSSVGGFSWQACLYKIFIPSFNSYCMFMLMCVDVHVVFACMCVYMPVESGGSLGCQSSDIINLCGDKVSYYPGSHQVG